jgi:ABC-2 type transport system ATP-binding protein
MIEIKNLYFTYSKRNKLFENLNLTLSEGHVYGLLGKNGTGKTTLLSLISGLLFPDEGEIEALGKNPGKRQVDFLQELFLVSEEFDLPDLSPMKYSALYSSFYPQFNDEQYRYYLKEFEVDASRAMNKMSMGQRKKAYIAFALACNTRLLLMDEPTNGMDIPSKAQFRKLIASLAAENRCIVISTHQVRDLGNLIDTIVVLENHRIIFNQSVDAIAEKLSFVSYHNLEEVGQLFYEEAGALGGKGIASNQSGTPSHVDMELLFNGLISEKEKITALFTNNN